VKCAAVRAFLRVRADRSQKRQKQKPSYASRTVTSKEEGHKQEVTIVGAPIHRNKGTYLDPAPSYRILTSCARLPNLGRRMILVLDRTRMADLQDDELQQGVHRDVRANITSRIETQQFPEGGPMAMTIFLILNALGIVFLLYVLANFWKEGRRPKNKARKYAAEFGQREWIDVAVATHPISHCAQGGLSVIPFRARDRCSDKLAPRMTLNGTPEVPSRRFSTK
jgi:hypothetical protein